MIRAGACATISAVRTRIVWSRWRSCVVMAAALLLAASPLVAEDTPEQARQKAIKKAQDALIAAAKQGDVGQVRAQLQAGADVNARDGGQRTALLHAVRGGQLAVVRALDRGRRGPGRSAIRTARTALMEAARRKEAMPALDLVAAGADVNLADKDGWTALMFAAKEGTLAAARAIIRSPKQSSLDALAKETSALSLAAERGPPRARARADRGGRRRPQARDRRAGAAARGAGRARRRRAHADGGESAARVLRVGERAAPARRRRPWPVAGRGGAARGGPRSRPGRPRRPDRSHEGGGRRPRQGRGFPAAARCRARSRGPRRLDGSHACGRPPLLGIGDGDP